MSVQGKINFILMSKLMSEAPTRKGSPVAQPGEVHEGLREGIHPALSLRPRKVGIGKRI